MPSRLMSELSVFMCQGSLIGNQWAIGDREKSQKPSSKHQKSPKSQASNERRQAASWDLELGISLVFGDWFLVFFQGHSYLSASMGSIRVARRAGITHATHAAATKAASTTANVIGSVGVTEYRWCARNRVKAHAARPPIKRPTPTARIPWPTTNRTRSDLWAPRAERSPI